MNKLLNILGLSVIVCGCCSNMECADSRPTLHFSYLSQDGEDLLSGQFKKYNLDDIKIYFIEPSGNKQFLSIEFKTEVGRSSVGLGIFTSLNERWFLNVKGIVADTLDLKFKANEGRCCGTQTWIDELFLNGTEAPIGVRGSEVLNLIEKN